MSVSKPRFAFVTVNPAMSGLTFAAERLGGELLGSALVPVSVRNEYEAFFGRGACHEPYELADIVVGELPFSMFVQSERPDPAVRDVLIEALRLSANAQYLLFRVNWTDAARLGVGPKGYLDATLGVFPLPDWSVVQIETDASDSIFIGVKRLVKEKRKRQRTADLESAKADLTSVASWWAAVTSDDDTLRTTGVSVVPFSLGDTSFGKGPQETLKDKGYPEAFALHHAMTDGKLIKAAVDVVDATKALVALVKVGE